MQLNVVYSLKQKVFKKKVVKNEIVKCANNIKMNNCRKV